MADDEQTRSHSRRLDDSLIAFSAKEIFLRIESSIKDLTSKVEAESKLIAARVAAIESLGTQHTRVLAEEVNKINDRLREVETNMETKAAVDQYQASIKKLTFSIVVIAVGWIFNLVMNIIRIKGAI